MDQICQTKTVKTKVWYPSGKWLAHILTGRILNMDIVSSVHAHITYTFRSEFKCQYIS